MSAEVYDKIGVNYAALRRPDPRIEKAIHAALGDAGSVVNVGAGAGSYEPPDRCVVAVEPSAEMIRKRAPDAAPVVQAKAEALPFPDHHFDAAMAVLTIHHWSDRKAGLREMMRVSRGPVVLLTFDPAQRPWPTDYWPELAEMDEAKMPKMAELTERLGQARIEPLLIPHDCTDGFLYAYWRRPEAYLDPTLRSGSSSFWAMRDVETGLARLRSDLESGAWARRYADISQLGAYDAGYRLVVADARG